MASANTRRANAAKRQTTKAVANTKATNAVAKRGRPATDDVLVRVNPAMLAALVSAATDAIGAGAPVAPVAPDIGAIMADIGTDIDTDAANVALAETIQTSMDYAANYSVLVAAHNAANATLASALNALRNAKPISRKAN
jgi:hypothetical protein